MKFIYCFILVMFSASAGADVLYQSAASNGFQEEFNSYNYGLLSEKSNRSAREDFFLGYAYYSGKSNQVPSINYCKAYEFLSDSSSAGISDASYILAVMYYNDECVKRDLEKSRNLLTSSAEDGYVQSQALMGRAYVKDYAVDLFEKNYIKGRVWLKEAAKSGDAPSAIRLSSLYEKGLGGNENARKAFQWRLKSTTLKYGEFNMAYFNTLARYYEEGYGTDTDFIQAYKYYDLSGSIGARGKRRVSKLMTVEQLNEAGRQSRQWQEDNNRYGPGYNGLQHQADGSYR